MIRFSLSQLEALHWVARLGSFRAAAVHLGVSQPSVTLRIRKLEKAIETKLFDRSGYRPVLTAEGGAVMRYARQTLILAGKIQDFNDVTAMPVRLLRFGMVDYTAMTEMSKLLKMFEINFPRLDIDLTVDYSAKLNALLAERKLDIAVLTEPKHHPGMEAIPVSNVELTWAGSSRLNLPQRKLQPKDLVGQRIVTNPSPSNLYNSIVDWFGADGLTPERISTHNTLSGIRQLVADGFAISVMPNSLLEIQPGEVPMWALRVSRPIKSHNAYVAFNNDNSDSTIQSVLGKVVDTIVKG
jgi:DNA-binding transcriptional LysR family regulator